MRCLALAEELADRGLRPLFFADFDSVPFARNQLAKRGFEHVTPAGDLDRRCAVVAAMAPLAVVIDSYLLPGFVYSELRRLFPTLAIIDGDPHGRSADVLVDQNIGAESDAWPLDDDSVRLAGLRYALIRDDVLAHRTSRCKHVGEDAPKVFAFFGGTDPRGTAPLVVDALIRTGRPHNLTVVGARPELRSAIRKLVPARNQRLNVITPTDRLPEFAVGADLVVSASGSSTWELLCLGSATAFVCVAENQRTSHARMAEAGYGFDLGDLEHLRIDPAAAVATLRRALDNREEREQMQQQALMVIDGEGRRRVADVLLEVVSGRR